MSLTDIITQHTKQHGPITIAEYMSLALSHPELGYYMRKDPLGAEGDFTTAPEISQIFGELIGAWVASQWMHLGMPEAALIELGPGRGTLMADALRATKHIAGFHSNITVHLIETSPTLKHKQWNALGGKHPHIEWHETIDALPENVPWLVITNEFFDALPIRQFIFKDSAWYERMVSAEKGHLSFVTNPIAPKEMEPVVWRFSAQEHVIYEYSEATETFMSTIVTHIAKNGGAALIVDYGYEYGSNGDTLQAVKNHKYHDVLKDAGEADLTAHVDFSALINIAKKAGVTSYGPIPQGRFLGRLGAIPRAVRLCEGISQEQQATIMSGLRRLLAPDEMGELFKVMCVLPKKHVLPEGFE